MDLTKNIETKRLKQNINNLSIIEILRLPFLSLSVIILSLAFLAVDSLLSTVVSHAGIANTKHNLSVTGPGPIKAEAETEICVFCHIPHNANPAVPLWNHQMPNAAYTMYKSEYLYRAGYTAPTDLGQYPNVGYRSRLCLSCHDGTVALGGVYILRGTVLASPISMQRAGAPITYMPTDVAGYIGTDLTNDHPVGIKYDTGITITFGSGTRTMELTTPAPPINPKPYTGVKLYPPQSGTIQGYVECTSCHDPHTENQKFLALWDTNLAITINTVCSKCHTKTNWTGSIHQTSSAAYTDTTVQSTFGANTVNSLLCMNCHKTHSGLGVPYLLRQMEETTCFQGAAGSATGAPCHGTGAATGGKNIQSVITRTYKHPTTTISGVHTNLDVLYPQGGTPAGSKGLYWSDSKHAECVDCHNPHRARQGTHTPANQWYPSSPTSTTNNVSNALTGVTGVEPSWPSIWTVPVTFTTQESSTKEYQICFKCHTYYALQDPDGITSYTTSSGATVTDQSMEFNPNNKSAHPAVVTLNSQTGSYSPKALTSSQMSSPWTTNVGNQTMYCSDCHGTDAEASTDPKGPHGSSYKYMLKGTGKYWPTKSDGSTLWRLNTTDAQNTDLFCKNCHPIYDGSWKNNAHSGMASRNPYCVNCHVAVPHGSKRSRLIGYNSDPAPYDYNNSYLGITGFKKAGSPTGYAQSNCSTNCGGHGGSVSGADP